MLHQALAVVRAETQPQPHQALASRHRSREHQLPTEQVARQAVALTGLTAQVVQVEVWLHRVLAVTVPMRKYL
jgi:hypothetical protein